MLNTGWFNHALGSCCSKLDNKEQVVVRKKNGFNKFLDANVWGNWRFYHNPHHLLTQTWWKVCGQLVSSPSHFTVNCHQGCPNFCMTLVLTEPTEIVWVWEEGTSPPAFYQATETKHHIAVIPPWCFMPRLSTNHTFKLDEQSDGVVVTRSSKAWRWIWR